MSVSQTKPTAARYSLVWGIIAVIFGSGIWGWWQQFPHSRVAAAFHYAPTDTLRYSYTDWAAIKAKLSPKDLQTNAGINKFLDAAFDAELTSISSITEGTVAMQAKLGFSGVTAMWEGYAQSKEGAVLLLGMPTDFDFDIVEKKLQIAGYRAPAKRNNVWQGGIDLVAKLDPTFTPVVQYIGVLPGANIVIASDTAKYANKVFADINAGEGLAASQVAKEISGDPMGLVAWMQDFACVQLGFAEATTEVQAEARKMITTAGDFNPVTGVQLAGYPDGNVAVKINFENAEQAKNNLATRAKLAASPGIGRGELFTDLFSLQRSYASGRTVILELKPKPGVSDLLGQLASGSLIFASC